MRKVTQGVHLCLADRVLASRQFVDDLVEFGQHGLPVSHRQCHLFAGNRVELGGQCLHLCFAGEMVDLDEKGRFNRCLPIGVVQIQDGADLALAAADDAAAGAASCGR